MEKNISLVWWQGFENMPSELWGFPRMWGELNPGHQILYWDSKNIGKLVAEHYPLLAGIFARIARTETEKVAAVKSSDLARLLILHHHGGLYVDTDTEPFLPVATLFGGPLVRHRFAKFDYSRNGSEPTVLSDGDEPHEKETVDWSKYEMILSREHHPSAELGGALASNAAIMARKGSKLLEAIISGILPDWKEPVLRFAGPLAFSRSLLNAVPAHRGKAYTLPPWYLTWQPHDQGPPWRHTISAHHNRMEWTDKSRPVPWDI